MAITLKDRMTADFVRLRLDMSVDEARSALAGQSMRLGAVFDDEDRPVTLLSSDDLETPAGAPEQASSGQTLADLPGLPPGIVAPSDMTVDAFAKSGAYVTLDLGARGALVIEEGRVVGALPGESIDKDLLWIEEKSLTTRGSDVGLAGRILTGKVVLYCDEFHHRNELAYYNRRNPPMCQVATPHPHPIRKI